MIAVMEMSGWLILELTLIVALIWRRKILRIQTHIEALAFRPGEDMVANLVITSLPWRLSIYLLALHSRQKFRV
jgi:hypothetical protein